MPRMVHDRLKDLKGPPRQSYAFRIDNLSYIGRWEAQQDKAEATEDAARSNVDTVDLKKNGDIASEDEQLEKSWQVENRPITSLYEIYHFVLKTVNKLASSKTVEEAAEKEKELRTKDLDIQLSNGTSAADSSELDAKDYRNEYSMMNDAKGSATISTGNNCHSLIVFIAGLPFYFPVTNRLLRNGEELLLSYGPYYWTDSLSTEALLSSTYDTLTGMLKMAFCNQKSLISARKQLMDDTCQRDESVADERAADDVTRLVGYLSIRKEPEEQRITARKWISELKKRTEHEGRGNGFFEALAQAGDSLARGDELAQTFSTIRDESESLRKEYHQRALELKAQVDRSEEARKNAEELAFQLQRQMVALKKNSKQQTFRYDNMAVDMRRLHAISQRHFVERERITSLRSFHTDDCPYSKVTELLRIGGLSLHFVGDDLQRHEGQCKPRRMPVELILLDQHISKCSKCGWPFIKGPLAAHGELQHSRHCHAENNDIAELVEEGKELTRWQGALLQKCFNMVSCDSVISWFLFELLCCLAKTFSRLRSKHSERFRQWQKCFHEEPRSAEQRHTQSQHRARKTQSELQQKLQQQEQLYQNADQLEDGKVKPCGCGRVEATEIQRMIIDETTVPAVGHRDVSCINSSCNEQRIYQIPGKSGHTSTNSTSPTGEPLFSEASSSGRSTTRISNSSENFGSSMGGPPNEARENTGFADVGGMSACICGGGGYGERAVKHLFHEGITARRSCSACVPTEAASGTGLTMSECPLDFDGLVLQAFEDPVLRKTDWVGWLLDLPALRWRITGDTDAERERQIYLLMCDFPLLLHAVFAVCYNNCLGFTLIPSALNEGNWLGEFLEITHQCLEEIESESETNPKIWISRFFRAVEAAYTALDNIETKRRNVDAVRLERGLARRRLLLRRVEKLRDLRAAVALRRVNDGTSSSKTILRTESAEKCELWREIYRSSESVKSKVSLHLNAWGQELACFKDTCYLRLEQYERQEIWKRKRLSFSTCKLRTIPEIEKYMTREQNFLAFRDKQRQAGERFLCYFAFRTRTGGFDDLEARVKYFGGKVGGNLPSAVNRTLALLAKYAEARRGTWDRDVNQKVQRELEEQIRQISNVEEADRLLGKPLFDLDMKHWPHLREVVEIGAQRAVNPVQELPNEALNSLKLMQQEESRLRKHVQELQGQLKRLQLQQQAWQQVMETLPESSVTISVTTGSSDKVQQPQLEPSRRSTNNGPRGNGNIKQELRVSIVAHERIASQDPNTHPCPLLLLHCEGSSAHTVLQRGAFPRIPKEVRDDTPGGEQGACGAVFRYLLPATPFVFEPPIDVNKSGCLNGYLPSGLTDHFTLDAVLRLPILTTDGSRLVSVNASKQWHHPQHQQHIVWLYDPLVCTRLQQDSLTSGRRPVSSNASRGESRRFENSRAAPPDYALLLGARYWTLSRGKRNRIERLDLGIAMKALTSISPVAQTNPFQCFLPFFKRNVSETTPEKTAPFVRVTLKCVREVVVGDNNGTGSHTSAMRVFPFVNGDPVEPLTVPCMSYFYKLCSIRGLPVERRITAIFKLLTLLLNCSIYEIRALYLACRESDEAIILFQRRREPSPPVKVSSLGPAVRMPNVRFRLPVVFSCDFNPEELPPRTEARLRLYGERYASPLPKDGCRDAEHFFEEPDEVVESSLCTAEHEHGSATNSAQLSNPQSNEAQRTAECLRLGSNPSSLVDAQGCRTANSQGPNKVAIADTPVKEARVQQSELQLLLGRLWNFARKIPRLPQTQAELALQARAPSADRRQDSRDSLGVGQLHASVRATEQRQKQQNLRQVEERRQCGYPCPSLSLERGPMPNIPGQERGHPSSTLLNRCRRILSVLGILGSPPYTIKKIMWNVLAIAKSSTLYRVKTRISALKESRCSQRKGCSKLKTTL